MCGQVTRIDMDLGVDSGDKWEGIFCFSMLPLAGKISNSGSEQRRGCRI